MSIYTQEVLLLAIPQLGRKYNLNILHFDVRKENLIAEAKIIKKPRRKQLNNRVGLVCSELGCSNLVLSNEDSPGFGVRLSPVSGSGVISFKGGKLHSS